VIVEDGTGRSDSNSYVSTDELETYADDRGITLGTALDEEAALIRASTWIDNVYRSRFQGIRTNLRAQAMEWPRAGVLDASGFFVEPNEIPRELRAAVCEAAIREMAAPGTLSPDLERGGAIKSLQAGSVQIVYADSAPARTTFDTIDDTLAALLGAANNYTGLATR